MRIRLLVVALVALLIGCGPAKPPSALELSPRIERNLRTLAEGLHYEVMMCLSGERRGDTLRITRMWMPYHVSSTPTNADVFTCPEEVPVYWHNHPLFRWVKNEDGELRFGILQKDPRKLCFLSEADVKVARRRGYRWVLLSVTGDVHCWWSLDDLPSEGGIASLPGQRVP